MIFMQYYAFDTITTTLIYKEDHKNMDEKIKPCCQCIHRNVCGRKAMMHNIQEYYSKFLRDGFGYDCEGNKICLSEFEWLDTSELIKCKDFQKSVPNPRSGGVFHAT